MYKESCSINKQKGCPGGQPFCLLDNSKCQKDISKESEVQGAFYESHRSVLFVRED